MLEPGVRLLIVSCFEENWQRKRQVLPFPCSGSLGVWGVGRVEGGMPGIQGQTKLEIRNYSNKLE